MPINIQSILGVKHWRKNKLKPFTIDYFYGHLIDIIHLKNKLRKDKKVDASMDAQLNAHVSFAANWNTDYSKTLRKY